MKSRREPKRHGPEVSFWPLVRSIDCFAWKLSVDRSVKAQWRLVREFSGRVETIIVADYYAKEVTLLPATQARGLGEQLK